MCAFSLRSIPGKNANVINICDAELIGKTLEEGKLKMHISKDYFGGELVEASEALEMMKESSIISLAGRNSVGMALANNLGNARAVRLIAGVPFLMIYKF